MGAAGIECEPIPGPRPAEATCPGSPLQYEDIVASLVQEAGEGDSREPSSEDECTHKRVLCNRCRYMVDHAEPYQAFLYRHGLTFGRGNVLFGDYFRWSFPGSRAVNEADWNGKARTGNGN